VLAPPHPAIAPPFLSRFVPVLLTATNAVLLGRLGGPVLAAGGLAVLLFGLLRLLGAGLVGTVGDAVASAVGRAQARARAEDLSRATVPARAPAGPDPTGSGPTSPWTVAPPRGRPAEYEVRDLLRASVAVATVAGVAGALALLGCGHLLGRIGQDTRLAAMAATVLAALAPGLVPCLWFEALRRYRQGMRRPGIPVWLGAVAVAGHLGLAWLLGFGAGPLPGFGAAGIGAATSAAYLLGFGLLYLRTGSDRALAPMLSLAGWRASLPAVRLLLRRARRAHPRRPAR
jgi:MATE family multidrug resistance protein